jgi:hypothetical protein
VCPADCSKSFSKGIVDGNGESITGLASVMNLLTGFMLLNM